MNQVCHDEFRVEGLRCGACALRLEKSLSQRKGTVSVSVAATTGRVAISSSSAIGQRELSTILSDHGLTLGQWTVSSDNSSRHRVAAVIVLAGMVMSLMWGARNTSDSLAALGLILLALPSTAMVVALSFSTVIVPGATALVQRRGTMDALLVMGSLGALLLSVLDAGMPLLDATTSLLALRILGLELETTSRKKSVTSIQNALAKKTCARVSGEPVDVFSITMGDEFELKAGDTSPVDALIQKGISQVDESALTGEPLLIKKGVHGTILAGTPVVTGALVVRAMSNFEEGALGQLSRSIISAASTKPHWQLLADRAAQYLVSFLVFLSPLVVAVHLLLGADLMSALSFGLATIVVTCPCALTLASPLVVMRTVAVAAQKGIVIRDANAIEQGAKVDHVVFDKTGTLVRNELSARVLIRAKKELDEKLAHELACRSRHPVSRAIANALSGRDEGETLMMSDVKEIIGSGVEGVYDGHVCRLGKSGWAVPDKADTKARTCFSVDGEERITFEIAAKAEESSRLLLQRFHENKIGLSLLTGDSQESAQSVGRDLGIENREGDLSPEDKSNRVRDAQRSGEVVAFVGDGLNDAPAMAISDVSIAVAGALEETLALAQVRLLSSPAENTFMFLELARRARAIMRQNIFWSVAYNLVAVPLCALGYVDAHVAAFAMVLSSFCVVANTNRLHA